MTTSGTARGSLSSNPGLGAIVKRSKVASQLLDSASTIISPPHRPDRRDEVPARNQASIDALKARQINTGVGQGEEPRRNQRVGPWVPVIPLKVGP
jgi:hypothetical protein